MRKLMLLSLFLILAIYPSLAEMQGDANGDGNITSVDALMALQMSIGKLKPEPIADMNGDGAVTAYDAFKILQLAVGDKDELFLRMYGVVSQINFGKALGDEKMNWYIEREDGSTLRVGVVIKNGQLVDFRKGELGDPTINVYTDERTVKGLLESKDPEMLKNSIKNGKIRIEGVGWMNSLRVGVMSLLSRFT